jgi:hypothetical protein
MPAEKIATTHVVNGYDPEERWTNILRVTWGKRGVAPDAPDGWVNAGYAMVSVTKANATERDWTGAVELGPDEIDHLIRVLKRVRRQSFRD